MILYALLMVLWVNGDVAKNYFGYIEMLGVICHEFEAD